MDMEKTPCVGRTMGGMNGFTPRQMEVLKCLWQGKPNKAIANELDMREGTVKSAYPAHHGQAACAQPNPNRIAYAASVLAWLMRG
jgi:FixJ family two-component response regulator